jgi:predicted DNA-binding transcriptional regulator AlpA
MGIETATVIRRKAQLDRVEAAKRIGVSRHTLARWAKEGQGPAYFRTGPVRGRVWYLADDIDAWMASRRLTPSVAVR